MLRRAPVLRGPWIAVALLASCRAPTQIAVDVSTDVSCASYKGVAVTVARLDEVETKPPTSTADTCPNAAGHVGTVVITPSGDKSDEVAVKIVAGVSVPASECQPPSYKGCIVARRALRFLPHEPLDLPVRLSLACLDNPCSPTTTCVAGRGCVSSTIEDPSKCKGSGCDESSLGGGSTPGTGRVRKLSAGGQHACALLDDGTVRCWGNNWGGRLGDGTEVDRWTAVPVKGLSGVKDLSARGTHTCAVLADATVTCWGDNTYAALGMEKETQFLPNAVPGVKDVAEVANGFHRTCVRHTDGRVTCWGWGKYGGIGDGSDDDTGHPPTVVPGLTNVTQLFEADWGTCARLSSGAVTCWGTGQTTPKPLPETDIVDMAVGGDGTLFVLDSAGNITRRAGRDSSLDPVVSLAKPTRRAKRLTGFYDVFALYDDGSVDMVTGDAVTPVPQLGAGSTAAVTAGANYVYGVGFQCALLTTGRVRCWGGNYQGELGNDRTEIARKAEKVSGLGGVARIGRSFNQFANSTWAVKTDGTLQASGQSNPLGIRQQPTAQPIAFAGNDLFGVASHDNSSRAYLIKVGGALVPVAGGALSTEAPSGLAASGFSDFTRVFLGGVEEVGVRAGGQIEMVATKAEANSDGLFALGNTTPLAVGVRKEVTLPSPAMEVVAHLDEFSAANQSICALLKDGTVYCWGDNQHGVCGTTVSSELVTTPNKIPFADPTTKLVTLAMDTWHACAVRDDGTVWCWGDAGSGQLGTARTDGPVPSMVPGITNAKGVSVWGDTSCAWLVDGRALCWGGNKFASLGDGTLVNRSAPAPVLGASGPLTDVTSIAQGCALHGDGTVSCWGDSFNGEVGAGRSGFYSTPVDVQGLD